MLPQADFAYRAAKLRASLRLPITRARIGGQSQSTIINFCARIIGYALPMNGCFTGQTPWTASNTAPGALESEHSTKPRKRFQLFENFLKIKEELQTFVNIRAILI